MTLSFTRFNHLERKKRDYVGGCQYPINIAGPMFPYQAPNLKGFGSDFKEQVRFLQPGFIHVSAWCKVLESERTMCPWTTRK